MPAPIFTIEPSSGELPDYAIEALARLLLDSIDDGQCDSAPSRRRKPATKREFY